MSEMAKRLDEFEQSTKEMPHAMRCAIFIDGPRAECTCDRSVVLKWIAYIRRGGEAL